MLGLAMLAYAITRVPDKYKPAWFQRLGSWQMWIGLVALIIAMLIVINPEFYCLGLLGDTAFFDLLVLAITFQLQTVVARAWGYAVAGFSKIRRFVSRRAYLTCSLMILAFTDVVSSIEKIAHRISS